MKIYALVFLLLSGSAFAEKLTYICSNKKVDPAIMYYSNKYEVKVDTKKKTTQFFDVREDFEYSTGPVTYRPYQGRSKRLQGTLVGGVNSDSGCAVDSYVKPELFEGAEKTFIFLKQEIECEAQGDWFACFLQE